MSKDNENVIPLHRLRLKRMIRKAHPDATSEEQEKLADEILDKIDDAVNKVFDKDEPKTDN